MKVFRIFVLKAWAIIIQFWYRSLDHSTKSIMSSEILIVLSHPIDLTQSIITLKHRNDTA